MYFRSLRKTAGELYLSDPVDADDSGSSITLLDTIADPRNLEDDICVKLSSEKLNTLVEKLPKRQKRIILLRYGLNGEEPLVQREVAALLGISRSYVSRIEKKALEHLKEGMQE